MLEALKRIETRRPAVCPRDEVRRVDEAIVEESIARIETGVLMAAGEPIDEFSEPLLAAASGLESVAAQTPAFPQIDPVPVVPSRSPTPPRKLQPSARSQAVAALAERIAAELASTGSAVLAFVSPLSDRDPAALIVDLAPTLKQFIDHEPLLLGANFEGPGLADSLGVGTKRGLVDVVLGRCAWNEAVCRSVDVAADFLPERPLDGVSPTLRRLNLGPVLVRLREHYRLILIDAGSLRHPWAAPTCADADGTCLLVRPDETPARVLRKAADAVRRCGGRLLGTVVLD